MRSRQTKFNVGFDLDRRTFGVLVRLSDTQFQGQKGTLLVKAGDQHWHAQSAKQAESLDVTSRNWMLDYNICTETFSRKSSTPQYASMSVNFLTYICFAEVAKGEQLFWNTSLRLKYFVLSGSCFDLIYQNQSDVMNIIEW